MIESLSVSGAAFAPGNLAWIAFGVTLGYLVGALPGLGKGTATAVAIPLTFTWRRWRQSPFWSASPRARPPAARSRPSC